MEPEPRAYASIDDALRDHKIPVENHDLIRRVVRDLGGTTVQERSQYIRVDRPNGPPLQIAYGWTSGLTKDEADRYRGIAEEVWPSDGRPGLYGLTHPVHGAPSSGGGDGRIERDHGRCAVCGMARAANGSCNCD